MTDNIKTISRKPIPDVIERLEKALELAKKGDLIDVVIGGRRAGGDMYSSYSTTDIFYAISAIEMIKFRLMDNSEDVPTEGE